MTGTTPPKAFQQRLFLEPFHAPAGPRLTNRGARSTRAGAELSGAILHSDRGTQYTSAQCRRTLELLRMNQSMSRTANCYDNAAMESFWASLKTEAFRSIPASHAEARLLVHDYIDAFYNPHRLYSSLSFQSPLDFESSLLHSLN